jgi:hypothetical protein
MSARAASSVVQMAASAACDACNEEAGMAGDGRRLRVVSDRELRSVRGGKSFWSRVKSAAKWAKDHVVGGAKWIGLKFRF